MSPLSTTDNCQSSSGLVGSCISAQDCIKRGGKGVETCAWGLGVCCVRKYIHYCNSYIFVLYSLMRKYKNHLKCNAILK